MMGVLFGAPPPTNPARRHVWRAAAGQPGAQACLAPPVADHPRNFATLLRCNAA